MPSEIPGGTVTMTVINEGVEDHAYDFVRLDEDRTVADVTAVLAEGPGPPPPWWQPAGGTGLAPGGTRQYTQTFEPGAYVAYCTIPAPDGEPHFAKGMIFPFTVTEGEADPLPAEDITLTASDFGYDGVDGVAAGSQLVKFTNTGSVAHSLVLAELQPGKTADDLLAWLGSLTDPTAPAGPPPVVDEQGPHFAQGMAFDVSVTS